MDANVGVYSLKLDTLPSFSSTTWLQEQIQARLKDKLNLYKPNHK